MNKTQSSVCNHQEKCPLMKLLGKLNDPDKNINQTERPSGKLDRKGNVSTTNSRIYKVMVEIRTGYGKSEADMVHLDQHGGVEKLLRIINIAENRISNVTLSLLGNLCMIPACRKKVSTVLNQAFIFSMGNCSRAPNSHTDTSQVNDIHHTSVLSGDLFICIFILLKIIQLVWHCG